MQHSIQTPCSGTHWLAWSVSVLCVDSTFWVIYAAPIKQLERFIVRLLNVNKFGLAHLLIFYFGKQVAAGKKTKAMLEDLTRGKGCFHLFNVSSSQWTEGSAIATITALMCCSLSTTSCNNRSSFTHSACYTFLLRPAKHEETVLVVSQKTATFYCFIQCFKSRFNKGLIHWGFKSTKKWFC